jgi:energy-converting hydrogenase B subunit D
MALTVALQIGALCMLAVMGPGVVLTRDPCRQAIAVSFYGLLLALTFFLFRAPDVALSQIVIGAVALPLMILLALAKVRSREQQQEQAQESKERP